MCVLVSCGTPDRENSKAEDASNVLGLVRSGADVASITRVLRGGDVHLQQILRTDTRMRFAFPYIDAMPVDILQSAANPYSNSLLIKATLGVLPPSSPAGVTAPYAADVPSEPPYCVPFPHARLVEPLLDLVRPDTWTAVPVDRARARRLLELYFLRDYPFFTFFHKDGFLHDILHGLDRFCSSLLVNAVLAYACHGDDELQHRADFWRPQSLCYQFAAEARRLWEMQCMEPSLTVVQAGMVLSAMSNIDGLDKIGWRYISATCSIVRNASLLDGPTTDASDFVGRNFVVTAWALYGWQALCALNLRKTPLMTQPPTDPLPSEEDSANTRGEVWILYPSAPVDN